MRSIVTHSKTEYQQEFLFSSINKYIMHEIVYFTKSTSYFDKASLSVSIYQLSQDSNMDPSECKTLDGYHAFLSRQN